MSDNPQFISRIRVYDNHSVCVPGAAGGRPNLLKYGCGRSGLQRHPDQI